MASDIINSKIPNPNGDGVPVTLKANENKEGTGTSHFLICDTEGKLITAGGGGGGGGDATAANQTSQITQETQIATNTTGLAGCVDGNKLRVDILTPALPAGAATEASLTSVDGKITACNTGAVVVSSSALPSGAATEATLLFLDGKISQGYDAQVASGGSGLQQNLMYGRDTNGNLNAITTDANNGFLEVAVKDYVAGQDVMASSFSVVIASDQTAIPVVLGPTTTNVNEVLTAVGLGTVTSTAIDMDGFTSLSFFGSTTNTTDPIFVQVSHDNSTWVENTEVFFNLSAGGQFMVSVIQTGARYFRMTQTDTLDVAFTLTVNSSKK